jgi:Ser/Thr protein kinase RdoA (MazF antagonist)
MPIIPSNNSQNMVYRVNPRSTGVSTSTTYEKHTKQKSLRYEAEELARCHQLKIQTEHVFTVQLLDFNEQDNRLITEKVLGEELFHTIWNPTSLLGKLKGISFSDQDTVISRVIETGSWLRKYHESSAGSVPDDANGSRLEVQFRKKVDDIRKNQLIPVSKLNQIENKFSSELSKTYRKDYLAKNNAFPCRIHGDFLIYNMMIDRNKNLHVLDFGDTCISGNIEDVARFYSALFAIAKTNSIRNKLLGHLPSSFLQAYGLPVKIVETPYFQCNLAYNYLTHLAGQFFMRDMLSWQSNREMSQITRAGLKWVYKQL